MYRTAKPFVVLVICFALLRSAAAHESNQYILPTGRELADMGDHFTRFFYDAINKGVQNTNARIRSAIASGHQGDALASVQNPEEVTRAVNREFPYAILLIQDLDGWLTSPQMRQRFPGKLAGYKAPPTIEGMLAFPLNPFRAWGCSSVNVFGVQFGTDKIGHFTDMGMHYWQTYIGYRAKGETEEQAINRALAVGMDDPVKGESKLLGYWTAGAYSNADLAVNYLGFVFYRNLTEPQMLKGQIRPPMLERDGPYWKIAAHVRPDSDFFTWFISDHLDEALNPSHYVETTRQTIRAIAEEHMDGTLEARRDRWGNRRSQSWFTARTKELRTYWGINYGHRGRDEELLTIEKLYFALPARSTERDQLGRTPLHRAVAYNDLAAVERILTTGADVNDPVRSNEQMNSNWGDTPLHMAVQDGREEIVRLLISRGADVNRANDRGNTPLHRAVQYPNIMAILLDAGASVGAADAQGRTPLHWAAMGEPAAVRVLLDRGADINLPDAYGQTSVHYAAKWGGVALPILLARGGDANARDRFGSTPLHVAAAANQQVAVAALIEGGAIVTAVDRFGATPLHDAMYKSADQIVAMLRNAGAQMSEPITASFRQ